MPQARAEGPGPKAESDPPGPADVPEGSVAAPEGSVAAPEGSVLAPGVTSSIVFDDSAAGDDVDLDPRMIGDVVVVYGERAEKPFERDTDLRLTSGDLEKKGVTNLADALELLPDLYVRAAGRGGRQIDIRGARKGSVRILIDGVAVSDPYYGNLDLSSIPVTDIEQIRVSAAPASPIDGTGGPGGVIEIHTRDAFGDELVLARLQATSLPSAMASATARTMLGKRWAARVSTTSTYGSRDFELVMAPDDVLTLDEARNQSAGAARLEYRRGKRRVVADLWMQHHGFVVPPIQDGAASILAIDGEAQGRVGLALDDQLGGWRVQGRGHYQVLSRQSTFYEDPQLMSVGRSEDLAARRSGLSLLANRALGRFVHAVSAINFETEHARVSGFDGASLAGRATLVQAAAGLQLEKNGLSARGAAGWAIPLGLGAAPWPEFKLRLGAQPTGGVELEFTTGSKGRVPTLRERFRIDIGNASLGPEHVLFGEAGVVLAPTKALRLQLKNYVRRTNGLIRFDGEQQELINTETMDVRGSELRVDVEFSALRAGAAYTFADVYSRGLGTESLDFFPRHRGDAYLSWVTQRGGVTGRLRYVGTQIDRNQKLPSRTLLDLSSFVALRENLLATLRLENALDHRYQIRAGVMAMGRTLLVSVQNQWK